MHPSADVIGRAFFKLYRLPEYERCLDVGSMDVNGTLRPYCPIEYVGLDIEPGPNVDYVAPKLPWSISDNLYDMVVSTSCLEHDPAFWLTFAEMARVLRDGGVLYINAPSNGPVHRHPVDCWRFYPDAAQALVRIRPWMVLIESFLAAPSPDGWIDFVAVFGKRNRPKPKAYLRDMFS